MFCHAHVSTKRLNPKSKNVVLFINIKNVQSTGWLTIGGYPHDNVLQFHYSRYRFFSIKNHTVFYQVRAQRYHQDGMLMLDSLEPVTGQAPGHGKTIKISKNSYVGWRPGLNIPGLQVKKFNNNFDCMTFVWVSCLVISQDITFIIL